MRRTRGKQRGTTEPAGETAVRTALTIAVLAGYFTGLLGPSNWVWGMNLLRYYPSAFGLLLMSAAVALVWFLPPIDDDSRSSLAFARVPPVGAGVGVALIGLALFVTFRTKSFLLGDGLELIRRLHQGEVPAPRSPLFNAVQPVFYRMLEQGDSARGGESAAAISFLAGFLGLLGAVFYLARLARRQPAAAITAGTLLLLTCGMQLFFGYVEVYSLLAAATLVFMAAAFDRLTGGGRTALIGATLAFGAAMLSHPFGTTLFLPWLYLVAGSGNDKSWHINWRLLAILLTSVIAAVLVLTLAFALNPAWQEPGMRFRYLSPQVQASGLIRGLLQIDSKLSWASEYTVLSWRHVADCVNSVWLPGAAALAFVVGCLAAPATRSAMRRPTVVMPLLGFVMILVYRIIWRTPLGAMRDWDLYAGLGFGIAAIAAGLSLAGAGRRLAGPVVAASLFFLVPWIGIQIDSSRAARRHFDGVDAEPRPEPMVAAQFHGVMGDRFSSMREFGMAAKAYERALAMRPRHEYAWRLGMAQFAAHDYEHAVINLKRALELRPGDVTTRITLGEVCIDAGRMDEADGWLDPVLAEDPASAGAWLQKGRAEQRRGRFDAAARAYARADTLFAPNARARRDHDRARESLRTATVGGGAAPTGPP
ncbi:MAG TPA: tetratricopeptide repeat protein [Candidatus Eisenbacteria bacterium]